jgi:hypothetical protein
VPVAFRHRAFVPVGQQQGVAVRPPVQQTTPAPEPHFDEPPHRPTAMTASKNTPTSPEFVPASLEAWAKAAAKSAPGGDVSALNWTTPEGLTVKPLYTAADV